MKNFCYLIIVAIIATTMTVYSAEPGIVSENQNLVLYADIKTGDIAVKNKKTGYIWRSNPQGVEDELISSIGQGKTKLASQVVIKYSKGFSEITADSKSESIDKGGLTAKRIQNGIKFIYNFKDTGFEVPVKYTLEENDLSAEIITQELKHKISKKESISVGGYASLNVDVDYNITSIELMPFFGAGRYNEKGYCFIPDGSGAIINFGLGKELYGKYSAPVYGSYKDTKNMFDTIDTVRLPVFGINKENNGFLAVIASNDGAGFINLTPAGNETSYTTVSAMLQNKVIENNAGESATQPITPLIPDINKNFQVKYFFLSEDDANYSGMARSYRRYLENNEGLTKLNKKECRAFYAELYGGVKKKKSIFGIPWNVYEPLTTLKDVKRITEILKQKGIDDIIYKYNNWEPLEEIGKIPNKAKVERAIGGLSGFINLIDYLNYNNTILYPDVDFINYVKDGNGISTFFDSVKSSDQSPAFMNTTKNPFLNLGKRWYMLEGMKAKESFKEFYTSFKKYNNGLISLGTIGNMVYSNNDSNGTKRGNLPEIWKSILEITQGKSMVREANAYAIPHIKHITEAPNSSSGNLLFDSDVPFYQIVLHGMVSYSSPALNMSSDIDKAFLKAIEYGASPMYKWIGQDPSKLKDTYLDYIYSAGFEKWIDTAAEQYSRFEKLYNKVYNSTILSHNKLAEGVYSIIYDGGTEVIVNYNDNEYYYSGIKVGAKDFAIK